jgi:hypothetical protein
VAATTTSWPNEEAGTTFISTTALADSTDTSFVSKPTEEMINVAGN